MEAIISMLMEKDYSSILNDMVFDEKSTHNYLILEVEDEKEKG